MADYNYDPSLSNVTTDTTTTPTWHLGWAFTPSDADHYRRLHERSEWAFSRLWLAFLILCGQVVTLAVAAIWGWAR